MPVGSREWAFLSHLAAQLDQFVPFRTKLEMAIGLMRWAVTWLGLLGKPLWVVADGAYAKAPYLKPMRSPRVVGHRAASPWDKAERRPSHADKRRAWRRELLGNEIRAILRPRLTEPESRADEERPLSLAA